MRTRTYCELRTEIRLYILRFNRQIKTLQGESVAEWALVSTIGCWGIGDKTIRIMAFMLIFLFFLGKLLRLKSKESFPEFRKRLEKIIICSDLDGEQKIFFLRRLSKINRIVGPRNIFFAIRRGWLFLLSYSFLTISLTCIILGVTD